MSKGKCIISFVLLSLFLFSARTALPSKEMYDLDDSNDLTVRDALTALQIKAGLRSGQAGMDNIIVPLQISAGLQPQLGYGGDETSFDLIRSGADQFLLPVEIGKQRLNLLVDTGSSALIVFEDRLALTDAGDASDDAPVRKTDTPVSLGYASAVRSGVLATADVRIGAYTAADMRIMLVQSPDSKNDPTLTAKNADGIIGLRSTEGISFNHGRVDLDAPLSVLQPAIDRLELNLPPSGRATLSFGAMPVLDRAEPHYVFKTKTLVVADPQNPSEIRYSDLQVPFSAKSDVGEIGGEDMDVLLDTGSVSGLVLDTDVAAALGYNRTTGSWMLPANAEIDFSLKGPSGNLILYPKFKTTEISVAPYRQMGASFDAVLGISRWRHYVIGYTFVPYEDGGPDGTLLMLFRPDMAEAFTAAAPAPVLNYETLPGLNSIGNDRHPAANDTGDTVVFESDRPGGSGGRDIYVWSSGQGILSYPGLNSGEDDAAPAIAGNGRYIAFQSDRPTGEGDTDIYVYDLASGCFLETPGLNTAAREWSPAFSRDGRYLAFCSDREGGAGGSDIYLYDVSARGLVPLEGLNTWADEFHPSLNQDGSLVSFHQSPAGDALPTNGALRLYRADTGVLETPDAVNAAGDWLAEGYLSPSGDYLAFQTHGTDPAMGLYDRDLMVYNLSDSGFELTTGLNSEFDEGGISFTGDGTGIVFHACRPGGMGGADIYFYRQWTEWTVSEAARTGIDLPEEEIRLTRADDADHYTLRAVLGSGQRLTLLLDTALEGILLFKDRVPAGACDEDPVEIHLAAGTLQASEQTCLGMMIGGYATDDAPIALVESQSAYNAVSGHGGLPDVDGVIGFRGAFLDRLGPAANKLELCFLEGQAADEAQAGISLGKRPLTDSAPARLRFQISVEGVTDPEDSLSGGYTQADIPFLARTDTGLSSADGKKMLLSTVIQDQLILDDTVAQSLGYAAGTGWGQTTSVRILLTNGQYLLPLPESYPVARIVVRDLSGLGCDGILSGDRWMDRHVFGFSTLGVADGGPKATIDLLNVKDIPGLPDGLYEADGHYLSLPGLNSLGDDVFGDISDDGQIVAIQSDRGGSQGGTDVYVYRTGQGLLHLPNLNSTGDDGAPSLDASGTMLAFHSDRNGQSDVFLYDLSRRSFIDLPGLNTGFSETHPDISADGARLVFHSDRTDGGSDLYGYDIQEKTLHTLAPAWLNTAGHEDRPSVNADATLVAFVGADREDGRGGRDVFLYDLQAQQVITLPEDVNTERDEDAAGLSSDGNFLAAGRIGGEIVLVDLTARQKLFLPGFDTPFDERAPSLSSNARYIVFHSDRPGGMGQNDIYVYRRDEADPTVYTVSDAYEQTGYVKSEDGLFVPNALVRVFDQNGNLVTRAVTNERGYFRVRIPVGVPFPLRFEPEVGVFKAVTDALGDDTYVPDFQVGNLKFSRVWIDDSMQTGLWATVEFDIEAETPKHNVYVRVDLAAGQPDDVDPAAADYAADGSLTALIIRKLGQQETMTDPVIANYGQAVTTVDYEDGSDNLKAHVSHTFIVPPGFADGFYTAVFSINAMDGASADDSLQGESNADQSDNVMKAPMAVLLGTPDKPNLRILAATLHTNSFELPTQRPHEDYIDAEPDLILNMEVESMAQDAAEQVNVVFELEVNGVRYPMHFAESNDQRHPVKGDAWSFSATCRPESRPGLPAGDRCASLFAQEPVGKSFHLFMNDDAYDALSGIISDTTCQLFVTVDPDHAVDEYQGNHTDNVKQMPVSFLAPQQARFRTSSYADQADQTQKYSNLLFDLSHWDSSGNDMFGYSYRIGPQLSYETNDFEGSGQIPTAFNFNFQNYIKTKIVSVEVDLLSVGAEADYNIDSIADSFYGYGVKVLGISVYGKTVPVFSGVCNDECSACRQGCDAAGGTDPLGNPDEKGLAECYAKCNPNGNDIWNSKGDDGNEKYVKAFEKVNTDIILVWGIPVTLEAGVRGELGIRGSVLIDPGNKLIFSAGPYSAVKGTGSATVDIGFRLGITCRVTILELSLALEPSVQLLPTYPAAIFRFEAPLSIDTLSGEVFATVRTFFYKHRYSLFKWKGLGWTKQLFTPQAAAYGDLNTFKSRYFTSTDFTGDAEEAKDAFIYFDWPDGYPPELDSADDTFSVEWEGIFQFEGDKSIHYWDNTTYQSTYGDTYAFHIDSGDWMSVWVDMNDDDVYQDHERIVDGQSGSAVQNADIPSGYHKVMVRYKNRDASDTAKAICYMTKPEGEYYAVYYNNGDLSGTPVYAHAAGSEISYDWQGASPKPGVVNADDFSVRWEGDFDFATEATYAFVVNTRDGVRVYVDDVLVIDQWNNTTLQTFMEPKSVSAGSHDVKVEYRDQEGGAFIDVDWMPVNTFVGSYYSGWFTGDPLLTRLDSDFLKTQHDGWDYAFDGSMTEGQGVPVDTSLWPFSVRWEGYFYFDETCDYEFAHVVRDGMAVYIDGHNVVGNWRDLLSWTDPDVPPPANGGILTREITAGYHRITLEYVEKFSAPVVLFKWGKKRNNQFTGQYFKSYMHESGSFETNDWQWFFDCSDPEHYDLSDMRRSDTIDFQWDQNHPAFGSRIFGDVYQGFQAEWNGDFDFEDGTYIFTATADDTMKVSVDGIQIIEADSGIAEEALPMRSETYAIAANYCQESDAAIAKLDWTKVSRNYFYGKQFPNTTFSGTSATTVDTTSMIYYDWGAGSPDWGGGPDSFSIRWVGVFDFDQDGYYCFSGTADDKITIWLDGEAIVSKTSSGDFYETLHVAKGPHSIRVEYVEEQDTAKVSVAWSLVSRTLWALDASNQIYRGFGRDFQQVPGSLVQIDAGANQTVWGVDADHTVYYYSPGTNAMVAAPDSKKMVQVTCGSSNHIWGLNEDYLPYKWTGTLESGSWEPVGTTPFRQIDIDSDGNVWAVDDQNNLYEGNPGTYTWNKLDSNSYSANKATSVTCLGHEWTYCLTPSGDIGRLYPPIIKVPSYSYYTKCTPVRCYYLSESDYIAYPWHIQVLPTTSQEGGIIGNIQKLDVNQNGWLWALDGNGRIYFCDSDSLWIPIYPEGRYQFVTMTSE